MPKSPSLDTAPRLLQQVLERFQLGNCVAAITPLGEGLINQTLRVDAANGERYVLQRLNDRVFPQPSQVMENLVRITTHLRHKGVPSLELIPCLHAKLWVSTNDGGVWRCLRFVAESTTYQDSGRASVLHDAAAAFGRYCAALADLPGPRLHTVIPSFHDTPRRVEMLRFAMRADPQNRLQQVQADADTLLASQDIASRLALPAQSGELPRRVVHNDTKLNNVLFHRRSGKALCVIDLDTTMPGLALHDFGDLVRSAATVVDSDATVHLATNRFADLLGGYLAAMWPLLGDAELHYLVDAPLVIAYELALRFLTDFLDGDRYFETTRPDQNLDRCRRQIALLRDMQNRYDDLRRIADAQVGSVSQGG